MFVILITIKPKIISAQNIYKSFRSKLTLTLELKKSVYKIEELGEPFHMIARWTNIADEDVEICKPSSYDLVTEVAIYDKLGKLVWSFPGPSVLEGSYECKPLIIKTKESYAKEYVFSSRWEKEEIEKCWQPEPGEYYLKPREDAQVYKAIYSEYAEPVKPVKIIIIK